MSRHKTLWFLVTFFLLAGCTSSTAPPGAQASATPVTQVKTAVPTPTIALTPKIGPVPQNCPISHPAQHSISSNLSPVIGTFPVWASWPQLPGAKTYIFHLTPPAHSPYPSTYLSPYGWDLMKVVWEVGPDYQHIVTLRGYDLSDHTPLLFQFLNNTPLVNAVLDPRHPDHPVSVVGMNWAEWGSYIIVPEAGCYVMNVSWPTGHWSLIFAVGA